MKIGMTSEEIAQTNVTVMVESEWLREIAYQLAALREDFLELAIPLDRALTLDRGNTKLRVLTK